MAKATAAQLVSALYIAVYNRAPETSGFNFWVKQLDNGVPLHTMADLFVKHAVFTQDYAKLSNLGMVERFYTNILGGEGDKQGVDYWVKLLDKNVPVGTVLAEFLTAALEIDLSTSSGLSASDWLAAQKRQAILTNKAEVATHYAQKMGASSELTGDVNSVEIVNDPKYQQAAQILTFVTDNKATVASAKQAIDAIAPPKEIIWQDNLMRIDFDDEEEISEPVVQINLNHSYTEAPTGPKELGNVTLKDFDLRGIEFINGGLVNDDAKLDWIYVNEDVVLDLNQTERIFFVSNFKGPGFIDFQAKKSALTFHYEGEMDDVSAVNAHFSDNVDSLFLWANNWVDSFNVKASVTIGQAKGLNVVNLNQLKNSSEAYLDLSKADVGGSVLVQLSTANTVHVVGSNNTAETIKIDAMGFNRLVLENMDFKNNQDKIDFSFTNLQFNNLVLNQVGNSVTVQVGNYQSAGTIEIVGAKLQDIDVADFIF